MADRRIRNHRFKITLAPGEQAAIDHAEQCEKDEERLQFVRGPREDDNYPKEAVSSHFQQNSGKKNTDRAGRLDMGEREPAVERENGHLDAEADQEAEERP